MQCHILRYIKKPPQKGLWFKKNEHIDIVSYTDVSYVVDKHDWKSTQKSKKQTVVSRSSVEVEYRTMTFVTCETMWIKSLMRDFGVTYNNLFPCTMIIKWPSILLAIEFLMNTPSIMRLIVILRGIL